MPLGFLGVATASATPIPHGGTIYTVPGVGIAPPAAVNGFNPLLTSSAYDSQVEGNLYAGLLWINRRFAINFNESIAKQIIVGPHHRSFTVLLHHFWRWSDGQPVTTADIAYTYHMILKLGPLYPGYDTGGIPKEIKSFQVLSPYAFRIVTTRPVNPQWFELSGLSQLTPYPKQAWSKYSVQQLNDNMTNLKFFKVVDGPFQLESFHPGRYVSIVPNPHYSGPNPPHVARVVFRFLNSNAGVFFALKRGAIQLGNLPNPLYPARKQLTNYRLHLAGPIWGFNYLGFNFANPHIAFIRNVLVRRAIMHAIDQDLMIKVIAYGHGSRAYGLIPTHPDTFLSPEAKALLRKGEYNPARAKQLLREAGWHRDPDGIREKNGQKLEFTLYMPPQMVRGPTLLTQMLGAVGIEVHLREKPFNEVYAEMIDPHNTHWQAVYLGWSQSAFPTGGSIFRCGGAQNSYHYCNAEMDRLQDAIRVHTGLKALYAYQDYFTEQQPVIVLPDWNLFIMAAKNIHGLQRALPPLGGFNPQFLWIDPEAKKTKE